MGKLVKIATLAGIIVCCPLVLSAQRINFDLKTTAQVEANTFMQTSVEEIHNWQVDSIRSKQLKLAELTASYAVLKDVYMTTLENAKGFGSDSGIYTAIVTISKNIVTHSGKAINSINNSSMTGKATAILKVADLVIDAAGLGNLFFNIVNNAEVKNPMQGQMTGAEATQKDKYNLLNRHERLDMALKLLVGLQKIDTDLVMLNYYLQNATFNDLIRKIDTQTWITYHAADTYHKTLIDQWNKFVK